MAIPKKFFSKEFLQQEYIDNKKSVLQISKENNTTEHTIRAYLDKYGFPRRANQQNLSNTKKGKWEVGEKRTSEKGVIQYNCKCECGTERWVCGYRLKEETSLSCGCNRHYNINYVYQDITKVYWGQFIRQAKLRDKEVNITPEQVWNIYEQQNRKCYYTHLDLTFKYDKYPKEINASIDRIENDKPYSVDNIRIVHKTVNMLRGSTEHEALIYLCNKIADVHKHEGPDLELQIWIDHYKIRSKK